MIPTLGWLDVLIDPPGWMGANPRASPGLLNDRTNSIEVGMQSSALAAVLAKIHFADPIVVVPCILSACTHSTMGRWVSWSLV